MIRSRREGDLETRIDWTQPELAEGLRCYRSEKFFDAHEHWETVWLTLTDAEKKFLQALIQISAAFHHFGRENRLGTASLLQAALDKLSSFPVNFGGVDVAVLRGEISGWLALLSGGGHAGTPYPAFPKIREEAAQD